MTNERNRILHVLAMRCASAILVLVAVLLTGCGGSVPAMTQGVTPDDWEENLLAFRQDKDRQWAVAVDSPIHPSDKADFQGLEYYAPDPAYRVVGPMQVHASPESFTILTTTGKTRQAERYGMIRFVLHGKELTLQVYKLLDSPAETLVEALFLPFTDETSGVETYPAGRYVKFEEAGDDRYILDFNQAHNPHCAYGMPEMYACPVTPGENRLAIRIAAGEKGYKRQAGQGSTTP
jgi:uncharacterized protein (DUF1684 family)